MNFVHIIKAFCFTICLGNHRGDLCELDMDKDGTYDRLDNCPENKFINTTSFVKHTTVDFIPSWTSEPAPIWRVLDNGMEIRQDGKTRKAVALIGMYPVLIWCKPM